MQRPNNRMFYPSLCLLAIVFSVTSFAQDNHVWPVKVQKEYSKTYPVGTELVALMNRYGKMTIETWDKNEVKVEAVISIGGQTNESANRLLERISIKDEKKSDAIEFKTEFGDKTFNWSDDNTGGHEMRIDWVVRIPASAKLYAENNFGPLTIGDYKGEAEFVCKYGTLTAGKLSNCKSVRVDFGKAVIESLTDSKMNFRYSRIDIAKLSGTITGELQFCNSTDLPVDNSLKKLELKNNYSSLYLITAKDFSATYDITTNNARATGKGDIVLKEEVKAPANGVRYVSYSPNKHYTGSIGKGGGTEIVIKSNFGNIRFL
jgi:hypothetical protein